MGFFVCLPNGRNITKSLLLLFSSHVGSLSVSVTSMKHCGCCLYFLSFAFGVDRMTKQMEHHQFKSTNKCMGCNWSLFAHKQMKSVSVVGLKTLHHYKE